MILVLVVTFSWNVLAIFTGTFTLYMLMCTFTVIFVTIWVPETKGKTLEEIQFSFRWNFFLSHFAPGFCVHFFLVDVGMMVQFIIYHLLHKRNFEHFTQSHLLEHSLDYLFVFLLTFISTWTVFFICPLIHILV